MPGTLKVCTHINAVNSQNNPTECVLLLSPLNRELLGTLLLLDVKSTGQG